MRRVRRTRVILWRRIALLAVGASLAAGAISVAPTAALFSDQAQPAAVVGSSAITLSLTPQPQTYTIALAPGESFTTAIIVTNSGGTPLRYALVGQSDTADNNTIASRLQFRARTGVTTCTTAGYTGSGTSVAGPVPAASVAGTNILGNPAQGQHTGDRVLNAGSSETLCIQITLPANQLGDIGGRVTTLTYTFAAEQTANNP